MPRHRSKNNSAWSRINKFLVDHDDYLAAVNNNAGVQSAVAALNVVLTDIASAAGIDAVELNASAIMPCALNVWVGRLTYDTYSKNDDGVYVADHKVAFTQASFLLRKTVRSTIDAHRMLVDLENSEEDRTSNPGGAAVGEAPAEGGGG